MSPDERLLHEIAKAVMDPKTSTARKVLTVIYLLAGAGYLQRKVDA